MIYIESVEESDPDKNIKYKKYIPTNQRAGFCKNRFISVNQHAIKPPRIFLASQKYIMYNSLASSLRSKIGMHKCRLGYLSGLV